MINNIEKNLEISATKSSWLYLLPNLFTTTALFSGFYAIIAAIQGHFEIAALSVFIASIADILDGRVARLTHTQSAFGSTYDSISDMVAFGVAPPLMMYLWSLHSLGKIGWVIAFIYLTAVALRLARFSIQTSGEDKRFFSGLASPPAAVVVVCCIWLGSIRHISGDSIAVYMAALLTILAILLVSTLRYYSFKTIKLKDQWFVALLFLVIESLIVFIFGFPEAIITFVLLYSLSGPTFFLWKLCQPHKKYLKTF